MPKLRLRGLDRQQSRHSAPTARLLTSGRWHRSSANPPLPVGVLLAAQVGEPGRGVTASCTIRPVDNGRMTGVDDVDYTVRWPKDVLRSAITELINRTDIAFWDDRVEMLLEDAFVDFVGRDEFHAIGQAGGGQPDGVMNSKRKFLAELLRKLDRLPQESAPKKYWSERTASGLSADAQTPSLGAVRRELSMLVRRLDDFGYFELAFGKDCVDDPRGVDPSELIADRIGFTDLWPITPDQLPADRDVLFDVIEVLHDLVARPRGRDLHSYNGCGYHHKDFSRSTGQRLYRWYLNQILDRGNLDVRFAEEGEDLGRLVVASDPARDGLIRDMATRADSATGDLVRHAIALYRTRGSGEHEKRSAVVGLAAVLEERRALIKEELVSKDEGALFHIANAFAVRHRNDAQQSDYDPVFLDWLFWWYLSTIELTDRLIERRADTR